jgi:hypothetical protein
MRSFTHRGNELVVFETYEVSARVGLVTCSHCFCPAPHVQISRRAESAPLSPILPVRTRAGALAKKLKNRCLHLGGLRTKLNEVAGPFDGIKRRPGDPASNLLGFRNWH